MFTDAETHYQLLHLRTMTMRQVIIVPPELRIALPLPLDKKYASSPIHFDRITERQAMAQWINGYFVSRYAVDSAGSLEVKLRNARIARSVTPANFNYEYQPAWSQHTDICEDCGKEWPLDTRYWHKDRKGRAGLKTQCKYCRNAVEAGRWRERNGAKVA